MRGPFDLFVRKKKQGGKDQSGVHGEGRAEGEGRVHVFITKLIEEEEEEEGQETGGSE